MRDKLTHILQVLTPGERRRFWIQIMLSIFISIADVASLAFLLFVINFYISGVDKTSLDFLPGWILDKDSAALIFLFFIIFSIKNLLGILISNAQYRFTGQVAVRISKQKLDNYLHGDYSEYVNIDSAGHLRKIAFQPFEFCQHILSGIQQILIQSFLILFTIAAILIYNAQLFILLLVVLFPPVLVVFFYIKRKLLTRKQSIQFHNERSYQYLLDALRGYVEAGIYQRRDFFHDRFTKARNIFSKNLFESLALQAIPNRIIETFAVLGLFVLILVVKWANINDSSTLITIGAFMAAAYKIIPGVVKLINAAGQMRAHGFSFAELQTQLKETSNNVNSTDPIRSLELNGIDFQYNGQPVLSNFCLKMAKGDFLGITGKSGKGKTTVFNLVLGFLSPSSGNVVINDKAVTSDEIKAHWPQISYVRQQSFLIHDSILRNITLEENGHDENALKEATRISGLTDFIDQSPDGINKVITESGKNISGGQQQRIAIARALYKQTDLILLDEPFNELDEASAELLARYFKQLASRGKMVIMITHDSKSLAYCNKIISLDE